MITPQINKPEYLQKELDCLKFPWWNMVGLSGGQAGLKKEEKNLKKEDINGGNETSAWQRNQENSIRRLLIKSV